MSHTSFVAKRRSLSFKTRRHDHLCCLAAMELMTHTSTAQER